MNRWTFGRCLAAVALCAALTACARQDDEEAIRALIAEGAAAAEAHDIAALMAMTTDAVRASPMNLDRRGIRGVLEKHDLHSHGRQERCAVS